MHKVEEMESKGCGRVDCAITNGTVTIGVSRHRASAESSGKRDDGKRQRRTVETGGGDTSLSDLRLRRVVDAKRRKKWKGRRMVTK